MTQAFFHLVDGYIALHSVRCQNESVESKTASGIEFHQKELSYQSRLARLLNADPRQSFPIDDALTAGEPNFDIDQLIAQALEMRPDLQAQFATLRRQQKNVCLARLESRPDFTVGLTWIATSNSGISPVTNGAMRFY